MISIAEADNTSNNYATFDEKMVKQVPIIDPGHAAKAVEEDGPFSDTLIIYRGNVWGLISPLLQVMDVWPYVKGSQRN